MRQLLVEEGEAAVRWTRTALERAVHGAPGERPAPGAADGPGPHALAALQERRGAFVSLASMAEGALRGCAGFMEGSAPLREVLARAAAIAARDPRFPPVAPRELEALLVEVSVLSPPMPLRVASPERLPEAVRVGEHGLSVEKGPWRGLLLPQVALDQGLTADAFLAACCAKAGLAPDAWRSDASLSWRTFTAQVFAEPAPGAKAVLLGGSGERPDIR